jgi:hypothetical protein
MFFRALAAVAMLVTVTHCKSASSHSGDSNVQALEQEPSVSPADRANFLADFSSRKEIPFSPEVIRKITHPDVEGKQEHWIQDPVISKKSVENALEKLKSDGQPGNLAYKVERAYGLNEFTNSYFDADTGSYGEVLDGAGAPYKLGTSLNCFTCHSGRVGEKFLPGRGNPRVDLRRFLGDVFVGINLSTFTEIFQTYRRAMSPLFNFSDEYFTIFTDLPLMLDMYNFISSTENQSNTAGTSDPWGFAVQLFKWRNDDMTYKKDNIDGRKFQQRHVALDPMPWWNLRYKDYINYDGIIRKSARTVVQASFSPGKSGAEIRSMDPFYSEIINAMDAYSPPVYPHLDALRKKLGSVAAGERLFNESCARCHGTYSKGGKYERDPAEFKKSRNEVNSIIPLAKIGTDPQRIYTLNFTYIKQLEKSWMTNYGKDNDRKFSYYFLKPEVVNAREKEAAFYAQNDILDSQMDRTRLGYESPPLWGLWASAPYLHNGSVPTLAQFLLIQPREARWHLSESSKNDIARSKREVLYDDAVQVGLQYYPVRAGYRPDPAVYDTTLGDGRSNAGHEAQLKGLSISDKLQLLEYLKTL